VERFGKGLESAAQNTLFELAGILEKTHPEDAKAWSLSGDLSYLSNDYKTALEKYKKCINLNPRVFSVWDNTLVILAELQEFKELFRVAEQALDAYPNQPRAYYFYAVGANAIGRPDDALQQLEQALLMTGSNHPLRLELIDQTGIALIGKKDYTGAIQRYEAVLPLGGSKHAGILEHYGDALSLSGQQRKAVEQWKLAQAIRPAAHLLQKIGGE
jgi:tetratricopeptide (TPR) repeat protein